MRRNTIETVLGGVVIVVAGFFLVFAYTSADLRRVDGYEVTANFSSVGGLQSGSDVRISGVKVGTVTSQTLDPSTYLAVVHMTIDPSIKLPKDTVAVIASESLLGGKYMSLQPGGDPDRDPARRPDRLHPVHSGPGAVAGAGDLQHAAGRSSRTASRVARQQGQAPQPATPPAAPGAAAPAPGGLLGN